MALQNPGTIGRPTFAQSIYDFVRKLKNKIHLISFNLAATLYDYFLHYSTIIH